MYVHTYKKYYTKVLTHVKMKPGPCCKMLNPCIGFKKYYITHLNYRGEGKYCLQILST